MTQLPTEGGNEPESTLADRFNILKVVELILGIEPVGMKIKLKDTLPK